MNRGHDLKGRIDELRSGGFLSEAGFSDPSLMLVLDREVRWSAAGEPTINSGQMYEYEDRRFWDQIASAEPVWVNIAIYSTNGAQVVLICTEGPSRESGVYAEPALNFSFAGDGPHLRVET